MPADLDASGFVGRTCTVKNEAFLLFLAEMVEVDGQLTDPLDMSASDDEGQQYGQLIEQTDSGSVGESSPDAEEDEDEAI